MSCAGDLAPDLLHVALHAGCVAAFAWRARTDSLSWAGYCALFGSDREHRAPDLLGLLQLVHAEDRALLHTRLRRALDDPERRLDVQFRARRVDGSEFWAHATGVVIRDAAGRPEGVTGTISDISQLKQEEADHLHSERLESIGNMAGSITHDLHGLLTNVLHEAEALASRPEGDIALRSSLTSIETSAQHALQVLRRLQELSGRQEARVAAHPADELLLAVEPRLREVLGERVGMRLQIAAEVGPVHTDRQLLEQVLVQLCRNASEAMPDGGSLDVALDQLHVLPGQPPPHAGVPAGRYVRLRLCDDSRGRPATTRTRVFEPFFSTRQGARSFGLSTCHGIVRQIGGHIWVEGAPEIGCTVTMLLPAGEVLIDRPATAITETEPIAMRILLVDDDDTLRAVASGVLRAAGYLVLAASSAREALELAERVPDNIRLLVTDLVMPGLGGVALAERLQRRRPGMRVLYVSGYRDQMIELLDQHETAAVLSKPFTAAELLGRVGDLLENGAHRQPSQA